MKFLIPKSTKECLYANVANNEFITSSLFLLEGSDLKARMIVQGPIATNKISSSAEVLAAALRYDKYTKDNLVLNVDEDIDFEGLYDFDKVPDEGDDDWENDDDYDDDVDDVAYEDYYYMDDDDEYEFMEDDSMDDQEITEMRKAKAERDNMSEEARNEMKEKHRAEKMAKAEAARKKREEAKRKTRERMDEKKKKQKELLQKKKQMEALGLNDLRSGEPFQKTYKATKEGWYRFCLEATHQSITLEMELRTSSELGRPHAKTGHVQTYERHDMLQREKKLLGKITATNSEENGVKEEDLVNTKNQITKLNRLLYEIKEKQVNERHRLSVHKAVNEHSHSRMVLNALFETVFYIVVSGFQVYTIRKWFSGSPILGY